MVGTVRFELTTSCTPSKRATKLRYVPNHWSEKSIHPAPVFNHEDSGCLAVGGLFLKACRLVWLFQCIGKHHGFTAMLVAHANACGERLGDGSKNGGGQIGRLVGHSFKRLHRNLQQQASLVGDHAGGSRAMIEHGKIPEEIP